MGERGGLVVATDLAAEGAEAEGVEEGTGANLARVVGRGGGGG